MRKLLFLLLLLPAAPLCAQSSGDGAIRASVVYNKRDGTRSATVTDPDKGTSEETVTDSSGKIKYKVTYLLDEHSQPIGSITYNAGSQILYRTSFKRDASNRVDEESISSADGQPLRRRVYTYGTGSQVTNIMEYDGNGVLISSGRAKLPIAQSVVPQVRKAIPVRK